MKHSSPPRSPANPRQATTADKRFTLALCCVFALLALPICLPPWPAIKLDIDTAPGISSVQFYRDLYVLGIGWLVIAVAGLYLPLRAIRQIAKLSGGRRASLVDVGIVAAVVVGVAIDVTAYLAIFGAPHR